MSQPGKAPFMASEKDVFKLTDKGNEKLRDATTSLSPQESALLARLDGQASLGQVAAGLNATAFALSPVVSRLMREELIDIVRDSGSGMIEFDAMFSTGTFASPTAMALSTAEREAAAAETALKRDGYYLRSSAPERQLAGDERLAVLVIEGAPYLARFMAQYLALDAFNPRVAGNRDQIVAELRQPPIPDLVLLDATLPDVDGYKVLLKIRQHAVLGKVPVLMLTGQATRETVSKGLAAGTDGYIAKPVEASTLVHAVKKAVGLAT